MRSRLARRESRQLQPENGPKLFVAINSLTRSAALASEIEYQQVAAANDVISSYEAT